MGLDRAAVIGFMRGAFRRGESASRFIADMKVRGLSYRRTDMLSDWRSVNELEAKKGLMQYVRKAYYPAVASTAQVTWDIKGEYMYVVRVKSRIKPGVPITERLVNIVSDVPMTPDMVTQSIVTKWSEWEDYTAEELGEIIPWSAVHRVME